MALSDSERELALSALGFLSARVAVDAGVEQVLVTLERACLLDFELPGFDGDLSDLTVTLKGASPLFIHDAENAVRTLQAASSPTTTWSDEHGTTGYQFEAGEDRHWKLRGLTPFIELHAALSRGGGRTLWEAQIPALVPGEQRLLTMRLEGVSKTIRVRVLDSGRKPVASAMVYVTELDYRSMRGEHVDENGEAELGSLFEHSVFLSVRAMQYPPKTFQFDPIPAQVVDLVLDDPRTVEVDLIDRSGAPYRGKARVHSSVAGSYWEAQPSKDPGQYRLTLLPPGDVLVEADGEFGSVSRWHDTQSTTATLIVGERCSVRANMHLDEQQRQSSWTVSVAAPGASRDLTRARVRPFEQLLNEVDISGLAEGSYDVWLLRTDEALCGEWQRVGQPTRVLLDAGHETVEVKLHP